MVDREKRFQAADLIGKLMSGEITNYEYEDRLPRSPEDPAIHAIHTAVWFTYSDVREHRIDGKSALTPEARRILEQCIVFLKTDLEYSGPKSFIDMTAPFKRLWNFISRKKEEEIPSFWPFDNDEQLEGARRKLN